MQKYFKCRTVYIKLYDDLVKILTQSCPLVTDLSENIQTQIKEASMNQTGSLVFVWKDSGEKGPSELKELPIMFTAWLGKVSLRPFIKVDARKFYLTLIGLDPKEVEETCAKIKKEDQINSQKSMVLNPQSKLFKSPDSPKIEEKNGTETTTEADSKMQE